MATFEKLQAMDNLHERMVELETLKDRTIFWQKVQQLYNNSAEFNFCPSL